MQPNFQEEWLTAYLDDELDDGQLEIVRQQLANDPSARQMLEDLKRVRQLVGALPGWSGGDLQRQSAPAATLNPVLSDRTEDDSCITPRLRRSQSQNNSWRKWLGLCALAASILVVVGLAGRRYFFPGARSTVAMQLNRPTSLGTSVGTAENAKAMLDEESFAATKTPSSLSLPNSPTPALSALTADTLNRTSQPTETQPTEAVLADLNNERLNTPGASASEGEMRGSSAPAATADPALANAMQPAPIRELMEVRDAESKRQPSAIQRNMLPTQTRLGRSQAWQEQEASLAFSQVARLLAPTASEEAFFTLPVDGKPQPVDRFSQVTEEKSPKGTPASSEVQPNFNDKLDNQQQLPVALLQVEGNTVDLDGLFGKVVANYQLVPLQFLDTQLRDVSLTASADGGIAAGNLADKPLLKRQPELGEGLHLGRAEEKIEVEKLKEDRGQQGKSETASQQTPPAIATQRLATIVLFVTRREAQQIIDAIPAVGKNTTERNAGESTAHINPAWWFFPAGTLSNQPANADEKVILLLNPSP